jgi:LEA14-like dessication related protein
MGNNPLYLVNNGKSPTNYPFLRKTLSGISRISNTKFCFQCNQLKFQFADNPGFFNRKPKTENRKRYKLWRLLPGLGLIMAGLLASTGCGVRQLARVGELKPPKVTVQAVGFGVPHKGGWPVSLTLILDNPNPQTISILGYDYELWLQGRSAVQGGSQEPVSLPALGQTVVTVPMVVKLPVLLGLWPALLKPEEKLHYQVAGGVGLPLLLGGIRVPFRFQGEAAPKGMGELLRSYVR